MKTVEQIFDIECKKAGIYISTIQTPTMNQFICKVAKSYADQFRFIRTTTGEYVQFDDEDYIILRNHNLFFDSNRKTVMTTIPQKNFDNKYSTSPMAKLLLNLRGKQIIHYRDGNPLNLKRSNLDVKTHKQAHYGARLQKDNTSGYKGVSWNKNAKKYGASIRIEGKSKHLGYFASAHDAALAYNKAAEEYFGKEYAWLNKVSWNENIK